MITTLVRRVLPVVGVGVMFALAVRRTLLPPMGGDLWFHLRMGEEFNDGWPLSDPGHLGVYDSAEWLPTQWLPQLALHAVEAGAGLAGVLWVTAAVHCLLLAVVYLMCRSTAGPLPAAVATAAAFTGMAPGMSARPQVVSYLLLAVTLWAWLRTAQDGRPRYWLVLVAWAWVPMHGMWPFGVVLGLVMALGITVDHRLPAARAARLFAIPVASGLVAALTPLGWQVHEAVLAVGSRSSYFMEWGAPDFTDSRTWGVLGAAALLLVLALRRGPLPWHQVLLLGLAIAAALYSYRTIPVAAVLLAPLLAASLQELVPTTGGVRRREGFALAGMAVLALAAMALLAPARADTTVAPPWLEARLEQMPAGTRVLNDWDLGAYLLWRTPDLQLAMHGYGDVFTEDELERNATIMQSRPGWSSEVADLDADVALVQRESNMEYSLTEHAGWRVVERDDELALLAPPEADQR